MLGLRDFHTSGMKDPCPSPQRCTQMQHSCPFLRHEANPESNSDWPPGESAWPLTAARTGARFSSLTASASHSGTRVLWFSTVSGQIGGIEVGFRLNRTGDMGALMPAGNTEPCPVIGTSKHSLSSA